MASRWSFATSSWIDTTRTRRFGDGDWKALHAWLKSLDPAKLPRELPEEL